MKKALIIANKASSLITFRLDMMLVFQQHGYNVVCVAPDSAADYEDTFESYGIKYKQVSLDRNGVNPISDMKCLYSIYRLIREEKPDKIFAFAAKPVIYGGIAAHWAGVSEFYPMICGLGSIFRTEGIKAKLLKIIISLEYKAALKHCKRIMFQNKDDACEFIKAGIVIDEQTCFTNGSGVNCQQFSVAPLPEAVCFIMVARLIRDKGIHEYLQACTQVKKTNPMIRFLLVGPFDSNPSAITSEELQPYIKSCCVEYVGEQSDVRPFITESSVFVLPSYHEGTPKSTLEAMAMGRPVITTDAPGCRETVIDGVNGFLVPVKDSTSVAEKMEWFIQHPDEICKMGNESRKIAVEVFDVSKVNREIMNIMNF